MDEPTLVERCTRGDEEAFAELVDRYKIMVFSIIARMVDDTSVSDDLAQEVFIRVHRGLPAFQGKSKLSTWVYQITYRVCLEELKRAHRQHTHIPLENGDEASFSSVDRNFDQVDLRNTLSHYMARLPPHYKMALTLYYLNSKNYTEVADVMEVPLGTVKTYLYRAKQLLKQHVGK